MRDLLRHHEHGHLPTAPTTVTGTRNGSPSTVSATATGRTSTFDATVPAAAARRRSGDAAWNGSVAANASATFGFVATGGPATSAPGCISP